LNETALPMVGSKHQPLHEEGRDAGCVQEAGMRRVPEGTVVRGVHPQADGTPIQGGEETERVREAMNEPRNIFGLEPLTKQKIWDWLCSKPTKWTNGGLLVLITLAMLWAIFVGQIQGKDYGYQQGYSAGKTVGETLGYCRGLEDGRNECVIRPWWNDIWGGASPCARVNNPPEKEAMNFSAFLDWAGKVELPPVGWALLILLVLVILK
jgi:hypothetical protein